MVWCGVACGGKCGVVIRKKALRVMRNRETCFQVSDNLVFNTIFRYFRYDITPYSAINGRYRRS